MGSRGKEAGDAPRILHLGSTVVDLDQHAARGPLGDLELSELESTLLAYMAARPGQIVPREQLLADVWKYSPRAQTRAVDHTVSRLRRKIEPDPTSPRWLVSVRGRGYRLALAEAPDPVTPPEALIGRRSELAALATHLQPGAVVTLHGPPGVGKTRLAREGVAHGEDGGLWVELHNVHALASLHEAVAQGMGVRLPDLPPEARVDRLGRAIRALDPPVVVLDNAEHVADMVAQMLDAWAKLGVHPPVLVTSRRMLGMDHEVALAVPPLPPTDAVALMVARARQARWDFDPTLGEQHVLERIAHEHLDGLPLALELAAARLSIFDVAGLEARLGERFRLLAAGPNPDGRWSSLRAALAWSWELLGASEQSALVQCTEFRTPFDLEAAEAVIDPGEGWVPDLLGSLIDHALLQRVDGTVPRFRVLESVRAFAREQRQEPTTADRHLTWCATRIAPLADQLTRPHGQEALQALLAQQPDLIAAHEHALGRGDRDHGVEVVLALAAIAARRSGLTEAMAQLDATRATVDPGTRPWMRVQRALLTMTRHQEPLGRFRQLLAEALQYDMEPDIRASVLANQILAHHVDEQFEQGRALGPEALRLSRDANLPHVEGEVRYALAQFGLSTGDLDEAQRHAAEALQAATRAGDAELEVTALKLLSDIALRARDMDEVRRTAEAALDIAVAHHLWYWEGTLRLNLARQDHERGDVDSALQHFEVALQTAYRSGDPKVCFVVHAHRALCLLDAGQFDAADASLADLERLPLPQQGIGMVELRRSLLAAARGRPEEARDWSERTVALTQEPGAGVAMTRVQGRVAHALGQLQAGNPAFAEDLVSQLGQGGFRTPHVDDVKKLLEAELLGARERALRAEADALAATRAELHDALSTSAGYVARLARLFRS